MSHCCGNFTQAIQIASETAGIPRPPVDPFMDLLFQMAEDMSPEKFQIFFIIKMMKRGDLLKLSAIARRN